MDIAVALPGSDFVDESLFVGNAAVEALGGKDAKFGFRQIKPTDSAEVQSPKTRSRHC